MKKNKKVIITRKEEGMRTEQRREKKRKGVKLRKEKEKNKKEKRKRKWTEKYP